MYLYVKEHNTTGLKYLGKCKTDPFKYRGSGVYWRRHLKKHGENVSTEVLLETDSLEELSKTALYYSNLFDVANSHAWANLKPENGLDGGTHKEWVTSATKQKMSLNRKGKVGRAAGWKHEPETLKKMSEAAKNRCEVQGPPKGCFKPGQQSSFKGKKHSDESRALISQKHKGRVGTFKGKKHQKYECKHCNKMYSKTNLKRWHNEKCKQRTR